MLVGVGVELQWHSHIAQLSYSRMDLAHLPPVFSSLTCFHLNSPPKIIQNSGSKMVQGSAELAKCPGNFSHQFNAFLKIFRLEVLGDFDLSELEGLGEAGMQREICTWCVNIRKSQNSSKRLTSYLSLLWSDFIFRSFGYFFNIAIGWGEHFSKP